MSHFSKRLSTFVWAFLECMFFSSIIVGWTWLAMVFREDGYFLEATCNVTEVNVTANGIKEYLPFQGMGKIEEEPEGGFHHHQVPIRVPCRHRRHHDVMDARELRNHGKLMMLSGHGGGGGLTNDEAARDKRFQDKTSSNNVSFGFQDQLTQTPWTTADSPPSPSLYSNMVTKLFTTTINNHGKTSTTTNYTSPSSYFDTNHLHRELNLQSKSYLHTDTIKLHKITQPVFFKNTNTDNNNNNNNNNNNIQDSNQAVHEVDTDRGYPTPRSSAQMSDYDLMDGPDHLDTMLKVVGYCYDQNEKIRTMFAVVLLVRDLLAFPVCFVYDKYGTTRTRLLTVLVFAVGTLMMTFTSHTFPWLVIPALTITGLAGSAVFLTNLQTANLFGRKRHVVISLYVGAAYSNGIITLLMKTAYISGFDLQTSFMILTIAIVPILVSTVAFLPKTRIPWPLPADYGKRRNQSLDEAMLRRQRAWQRRMSEAGLMRSRKPAPQFSPLAIQSLFVWSILWFSCQRLQEAVFETHLIDIAPEPLDEGLDIDMETYYGSIQLLALVLAPLAGLLIDRDPRPALGLTQATQQMQRIVPAIVATSMFGLLEVATDMMYGPGARGLTILFNILHKVFTYTTMCAFVMHLHFNHQNLGKLYGLTVSVSAVLSAFQFPVRTFLIKKYDSMFPAHILLIILNLVALTHAINVWDHCRKRLIKDQSDNSSERFSRMKQSGHTPTTIHIETDDRNLPGNHGDRLGVSDFTEYSTTEVSGCVSSHNAASDERATALELMDAPTQSCLNVDSNNGGARLLFDGSSAFRDDEDDDDDEVYGDEDFADEVKRGYNGLQTIDFV